MGGHTGDMILFSFWPNTIILKELGDPLSFSEYLNLNRKDLTAKVILVQSEQSTDCLGDLNTCSPSFLQGFASVVSGENTASEINREFLNSRNFAGYNGHRSESAVLTYTFHYTFKKLGLGLDGLKHVVTPLDSDQIERHPNGQILKHLKFSCRHLIVVGPNCIIGCLPNNTLFMVQDRQKWRSGVIGSDNGTFVFSSDISALNAVLPKRNIKRDFQPMNMDIAYVEPGSDEIQVYRQTEPLHFLN